VKGLARLLCAVDLDEPGEERIRAMPLPWRAATPQKEARCPVLAVPARPAVPTSVTSGNPRRSDGVASVCSDQEGIMNPPCSLHAAPTWMDDVLADSFPASDPPS
jgi:hypothetical protein